jgi:hypothetical protein
MSRLSAAAAGTAAVSASSICTSIITAKQATTLLETK